MRKYLLVLMVFIVGGFVELMAQCQVSGNIVSLGNEPVAFANIIIESTDGQIKLGCASDDKGYFCLKNVRKGEYKFTASIVGYENYSTNILVSDEGVNINLTDIQIQVSTTKLSEVVVVGSSHVSEVKPSSIKYKTSSLISESGGTAGDILKNMPSVAMGGSPGHNRDIRFRGLGNAYTKVLINGREIGLSGNNRETVLDQIPAASISHIEIVAVPGPEYQSEGINGIVNIVLKDNANYGLHGKIEALTGNYDGLGGGISLSNKTEKLNLFANYDFLQRSVPKPKYKVKTDFKDGAITQIEDSYEYEDKRFTNHNLRTGFDYNFLPKTKFTGEYILATSWKIKTKALTIPEPMQMAFLNPPHRNLKRSISQISITNFIQHLNILLQISLNCQPVRVIKPRNKKRQKKKLLMHLPRLVNGQTFNQLSKINMNNKKEKNFFGTLDFEMELCQQFHCYWLFWRK